jgi:hypothetical protein
MDVTLSRLYNCCFCTVAATNDYLFLIQSRSPLVNQHDQSVGKVPETDKPLQVLSIPDDRPDRLVLLPQRLLSHAGRDLR